MSKINHIKTLINNNQQRLQKLKEIKATRGSNTPTDILIEIDNIENELRRLKIQLKALMDAKTTSEEVTPNITPPPPLTATQRRRLESEQDILLTVLERYKKRIDALNKDISREMDSERKAMLEERLAEVQAEWLEKTNQLEKIEAKLAAT